MGIGDRPQRKEAVTPEDRQEKARLRAHSVCGIKIPKTKKQQRALEVFLRKNWRAKGER